MSPSRHGRPAGRNRVVATTALIWLAAIASGCGSDDRDRDALQFSADAECCVLAPGRVVPGEVLGFAFPSMRNRSDLPVTITGFNLAHVPEGATVVRYRVLSSKDTHRFLLGSFPVQQTGRAGYDTYRGYPFPVIPPHHRTHRYGVVYLRVSGQLEGHASGCEVNYTVGEEHHTLSAACDFQLEPERSGA